MRKLEGYCLRIAAALLFIAQNGRAQDGHNHSEGNEHYFVKDARPQHGGELVPAGRYSLEVVSDVFNADETICVYVLKGKKELNLDQASGDAELRFKDGRTENRKMLLKNGRLTLDHLEVALPANITFRINVKGQQISGVYHYPGLK